MSETEKKKPNFKSLDLSKLTNKEEPMKTPRTLETPAPIEGIETSSTKKPIQDGAWINGKNNKETTPEEFREWLSRILPGVGVDTWEDKLIATPKDREKVIQRLSQTLSKVFCFPRTLPAETKEYVN